MTFLSLSYVPSGWIDAIMDRIVHNAVWLEMGDMNMRQVMAGKGR